MEVRWSTLAAEDLERIFRRIAKDNPTAARETVKTICDGCRELSRFPNLGRPGRMSGLSIKDGRPGDLFPKLGHEEPCRMERGGLRGAGAVIP
jgi:plasmid stabilization system protein ParE